MFDSDQAFLNFIKEVDLGSKIISYESKTGIFCDGKIFKLSAPIDLLLFNVIYNCYVVVELKVVESKKNHIGQVMIYKNYLDKHLKNIYQDNTIGIIVCKKDDKYLIEYSSDKRIRITTHELV